MLIWSSYHRSHTLAVSLIILPDIADVHTTEVCNAIGVVIISNSGMHLLILLWGSFQALHLRSNADDIIISILSLSEFTCHLVSKYTAWVFIISTCWLCWKSLLRFTCQIICSFNSQLVNKLLFAFINCSNSDIHWSTGLFWSWYSLTTFVWCGSVDSYCVTALSTTVLLVPLDFKVDVPVITGHHWIVKTLLELPGWRWDHRDWARISECRFAQWLLGLYGCNWVWTAETESESHPLIHNLIHDCILGMPSFFIINWLVHLHHFYGCAFHLSWRMIVTCSTSTCCY
jgi:hypothetical protein